MANRYRPVDQVLTDISLGYHNEAYIAPALLPDLPVALQSGKHFIFDKGRFRVNDLKRGPGARSKEVTHSLTTGLPYFCEDHAAKEFVADEDVDNAVEGMDPYADASENVTEMLSVAREVEAATILRSASVLTQNTTLSGSSQWSDRNSDPIKAIKDAKAVVHASVIAEPHQSHQRDGRRHQAN